MTKTDYFAPAALHLGTDWETAQAQGARAFRTAAQAIRFALEEAAPVSLHGARLTIGDHAFDGDGIKALYLGADYPLRRKPQLFQALRRIHGAANPKGKRHELQLQRHRGAVSKQESLPSRHRALSPV